MVIGCRVSLCFTVWNRKDARRGATHGRELRQAAGAGVQRTGSAVSQKSRPASKYVFRELRIQSVRIKTYGICCAPTSVAFRLHTSNNGTRSYDLAFVGCFTNTLSKRLLLDFATASERNRSRKQYPRTQSHSDRSEQTDQATYGHRSYS